MQSETLDFLEANRSKVPSRFVERALDHQSEESWQRWARQVALLLIDYMQENSLNRAELAKRLGVSPQYVSRLLSGKENLSFKSIAQIEERLGVSCMETFVR